MAAQRLFCFWRSYCRVANNNRARYPASRALLSGDCRTRPLRLESATADTLAIPVIRSSGNSSEPPSTSSGPIVLTPTGVPGTQPQLQRLPRPCSVCQVPVPYKRLGWESLPPGWRRSTASGEPGPPPQGAEGEGDFLVYDSTQTTRSCLGGSGPDSRTPKPGGVRKWKGEPAGFHHWR